MRRVGMEYSTGCAGRTGRPPAWVRRRGDVGLTIAINDRAQARAADTEPSAKVERANQTKRVARLAITIATLAIAVGYASAFMPGGAPTWAPWLLALGIPGAL